jgi:hypothetical protein
LLASILGAPITLIKNVVDDPFHELDPVLDRTPSIARARLVLDVGESERKLAAPRTPQHNTSETENTGKGHRTFDVQ